MTTPIFYLIPLEEYKAKIDSGLNIKDFAPWSDDLEESPDFLKFFGEEATATAMYYSSKTDLINNTYKAVKPFKSICETGSISFSVNPKDFAVRFIEKLKGALKSMSTEIFLKEGFWHLNRIFNNREAYYFVSTTDYIETPAEAIVNSLQEGVQYVCPCIYLVKE